MREEETDELGGTDSGVAIVVGGWRGTMPEYLAVGVSLVVPEAEYGGGRGEEDEGD